MLRLITEAPGSKSSHGHECFYLLYFSIIIRLTTKLLLSHTVYNYLYICIYNDLYLIFLLYFPPFLIAWEVGEDYILEIEGWCNHVSRKLFEFSVVHLTTLISWICRLEPPKFFLLMWQHQPLISISLLYP